MNDELSRDRWLNSGKAEIAETAVTSRISSAIQDCLTVISKRFTPEECEAIVTDAILRCLGSERSKAIIAWVKAEQEERTSKS